MTLEEARKLYEKAMKEEILSKYSFPTKPSSDGYFHIYVKDETKKSGRRQLKDKDLDKLREKVYEYEATYILSKRLTFKDVFNLVQSDKIKYVKDPEKLLSVNNSLRRTQNEYNRYFRDTKFENMYVDEITEININNIIFFILKNNKINNKAFLFFKSILNSTFTYAYKHRLIDENPYLRVDFAIYKGMIEKPTPIERRVHSEEDLERMLDYLHSYEAHYPDLMSSYALELQIKMGLRRGEVPPLTWDDVKDDYVLIHREQIIVLKSDQNKKQVCQIVDHTKTWKDRKYPLTREVKELLDRIKALGKDSDYIFPAKSGKPIHNNSIYHLYYKMCKDLCITLSYEERKGPHSYRRNAITNVANKTGDILLASKLFGNSPKVADSNYYTGIDISYVKEVLDR